MDDASRTAALGDVHAAEAPDHAPGCMLPPKPEAAPIHRRHVVIIIILVVEIIN